MQAGAGGKPPEACLPLWQKRNAENSLCCGLREQKKFFL